MAGERYVLLGLSRARAQWFSNVGQWATSAAIPAEFLKCVSAEELRARLASERAFSAALLDGGLPAVDRDLVHACRDAGCVALVVDDGYRTTNWVGLGAAAVLPAELPREILLDALATYAPLLGDATAGSITTDGDAVPAQLLAWRGRVAAVCGPGGTGASSVAIALAQGLARQSEFQGGVALVDLCRRAEQGMLHDTRDVVPGLQELIESYGTNRAADGELRALTFEILDRGYELLLGLRRPRYWSAIRPRAFDASFDAVRRAYRAVVCDIDADFEGEDDAGSADVEERNHMARSIARQADAVFAVGGPGTKGLHSLVHVLLELIELGVAANRIVPVVNRAPALPRVRAETAAALADLLEPAMGRDAPAPVFLPERRIDAALRDNAPLPSPLPAVLTGAFQATFERAGDAPVGAVVERPEPVPAGSLAWWAPDDTDEPGEGMVGG